MSVAVESCWLVKKSVQPFFGTVGIVLQRRDGGSLFLFLYNTLSVVCKLAVSLSSTLVPARLCMMKSDMQLFCV